MNKKLLSVISAMAAVAAILPGINYSNFNTAPELTANAAGIYESNGNDIGWKEIDNEWYYYDEYNNTVSDFWIVYANEWYYLKPDGKMAHDELRKIDNEQYYLKSDGSMAHDEWRNINNNEYYFNNYGDMAVNQFADHDGKRCYLGSDGSMVKNQWVKDDTGNYHYIDKDGYDVIAPDLFITKGVKTTIENETITQTKKVGGIKYKLVFDLRDWDKGAEPLQIIRIADLFWYSYPTMRARFVKDDIDENGNPKDVTITIAYSSTITNAAECLGDHIKLQNSHFTKNQTDYDAVTHELGHTLQNRLVQQSENNFIWQGWKDDKLENKNYSETFADYCRYMYAYNDGYYNDDHWTPLKEQNNNPNTHNSIRFLIWLDNKYSNEKCDIIYNFSEVCRKGEYSTYQWRQAWKEIFRGSKLENRDIDDVWSEYFYIDTRFSDGDAKAPAIGERSPLIEEFNIRSKLRELRGKFLS